ncbi:MAG: septal ring lytic transglycosylase RlpA family protein [Terriglobales bacterium]|jgi:rare lipoprotein A
MQRLCALLLLTLALTAAPVAAHGPSFHAGPVAAPPATLAPTPYQVGIASWYGPFFQGKETTSGQLFDMYALTAAHRELPLGTRVRVTNLLNHLAVVLKINDRGPVPASRIIDLSYAAARDLHFTGEGTTPVRIDVLPQTARLGLTVAPPAR